MTNYALEQEKQRRWVPEPQFRGWTVWNELLENEFRPVAEQYDWQCRALQAIVRHAVENTPYYAALFARLGLRAADIAAPEDLRRVPVMHKHVVIESERDLCARMLPPGEKAAGATQSSGTTGRPVRVHQSSASQMMFSVLWHRQARWFDLDPMGSMLDVRAAVEVGRDAYGRPNPEGNIVRRNRWRYLGRFFATGPEYGFNLPPGTGAASAITVRLSTDPEQGFNRSSIIDQHVVYLRQLNPEYAMSHPSLFEEWMMAAGGTRPVDTLKTLIGIGSQLTPTLRIQLEQTYRIPLHQTYGLNEFGKVGLRCEAGRYHIHVEHCLAEVVDAEGRPCAPGQIGHVVVTSFTNWAMPLLRYDTGDMAVAVTGPCPCGRTLPSIGEIAGRYREYLGLPEGTGERVNTLMTAFVTFPADRLSFLRRYQIHQDRHNRFELRLQTVGPIPDAFIAHVKRAWDPVAGVSPVPLTIMRVDAVDAAPSGKLLDFTSELYTDADAGRLSERAGERHLSADQHEGRVPAGVLEPGNEPSPRSTTGAAAGAPVGAAKRGYKLTAKVERAATPLDSAAAPGQAANPATRAAAGHAGIVTTRAPAPVDATIEQWPVVPVGPDASMLALLFLLEQTQYEPAEKLLRRQLRQAHRLVVHAARTVPFYRDRLAGVAGTARNRLTLEAWRQLPVLTRTDIQGAGARLHATSLPLGAGGTTLARTSGSSGEPIEVMKTGRAALFFNVLSLRYHAWFKRDFRKLNLDMRTLSGSADAAQRQPGRWGVGYVTGPSVTIDIGQPIPALFDALIREDPCYLQSHPFTLLELARHSERVGVKPRNLREARTFGELLRPEVREACRRVWGVPVTDNYSATETGIMALQCPDAEHYHVQAESVLLELLRDDGTPCAPGETGRVVVTALQNFAMPLIRYDIGDFAIAGAACSCGRTLPVISEIAGRDRAMLVLPDGTRLRPVIRQQELAACGPINQFQITQTARDALAVKLVVPRPWTVEEEARLRSHLQQNFRYPYTVDVEYVTGIPRSAAGKYEDFISRVGGDR